MAPQTKIQVFRIPADGSESKLVILDLYDPEKNAKLSRSTVDAEAILKHVPDLRQYKDFDSDRRAFFVDPENPKYYMYKCIIRGEANLPENRHLFHVDRAHVYGDAFVFKQAEFENTECKSGKVIFGRMEDFARSFNDKGAAYEIAKRMATWYY